MFNPTIPATVVIEKLLNHINPSELSKRLYVSTSIISYWKTGKRKPREIYYRKLNNMLKSFQRKDDKQERR